MTKVNQLLEKALSTQSEEEAISCLRLARKRHTGEAVDVRSSAVEQSKELYWREQARRYFNLAQERDALAIRLARQQADYLGRYNTTLAENTKLKREVDAVKTTGMVYQILIFALSAILITAVIL